jgi:macrolide-specific efflux system membrane fusion protein
MFYTASIALSVILTAQPGSESYPTYQFPVDHCVVSQIEHVQLPAQAAGVLSQLDVKDGDVVRDGDVLGKIDDTDALIRKKAAQINLNIAIEKATNDARVRQVKSIIKYWEAELAQAEEINDRRPGTVSLSELRKHKVQLERSQLDALVEEMDFKVAGMERLAKEAELEAVDNELERRTLRAPYDAVVVRLLRQRSEWVREGDPVLYLVRMDRLRVEGFVNADEVAPHEVYGAAVEITVDLVKDTTFTLNGTISYVSPVVESNGDYRVWAEVDNPPRRGGYPWLLRPGVEADMVINLKQIPLTSAP